MDLSLVLSILIPQTVAVAAMIVPLVVNQIRSRAVLRLDTYFKLEMEASRIFEISRQNQMMMGYLEGRISGGDCLEKLRHEVFWYLPQVLNVFEISIVFRKRGIFDRDTFSTWIAWFLELSMSRRFDEFWEELRLHYRPELRQLLDYGLELSKAEDRLAEDVTEDFFRKASSLLQDRGIFTHYKRCVESNKIDVGLGKMSIGEFKDVH